MKLRKIAVIGPESTGKSTLSEQLAQHFHTQWVPEYAREYLNGLGRPYREEDMLTMARGQKADEERQATQAHRMLVCDTTLVVIKVWSMHSFGTCHPWILEQLAAMPYDYFLLTDIDLPWQPDPLREHPHMRQYFFDIYKNYLEENHLPYTTISGSYEQRFKSAVEVAEEMI